MDQNAFYSLVPSNWQCHGKHNSATNRKILLSTKESEYIEISNLLQNVGMVVDKIYRHEQVHKYMMFLVRQQHLLHMNPDKSYFKVRRFVRLFEHELTAAVNSHLDCRRVPSVQFRNNATSGMGAVVLITAVITEDTQVDNYQPQRDSDYIIEYEVHLLL